MSSNHRSPEKHLLTTCLGLYVTGTQCRAAKVDTRLWQQRNAYAQPAYRDNFCRLTKPLH